MPAEERGTAINLRGEAFKKPNRNIAVMEGQCLAEVAACSVDTSCICRIGSKSVKRWSPKIQKKKANMTYSSPNSAYWG
jgi:hypothetical protein